MFGSGRIVKKNNEISIVRAKDAGGAGGNDTTDEWRVYTESIFYVEEPKNIEIDFYLLDVDLQPRRFSVSDGDEGTVLEIRMQLETGQSESTVTNAALELFSSDKYGRLKIAHDGPAEPGYYLVIVEYNLKGTRVGMSRDMQFTAYKSYFAIAATN